MRLLILTLLLAGCNPHADVPTDGTVDEGTFISISPLGDNGSAVSVLYADEQGVVRSDYFYTGGSGYSGKIQGRERLVQPEPIYQGNRFSIVKTGTVLDDGATVTVFLMKKAE
ncbi:hypothetical protein EBS80_04475 [bacterium]|nr:hypothetical protein [bacterium]